MPLVTTLIIAVALSVVNLWLSIRTGQARRAAKVSVGDGDNPLLIARMRAHANFIENAPFFLILLGLVEMARGPSLWLWAAGILFILARIAHVFGMDRPPGNRVRMFGMMASALLLVALAAFAIALPYLQPVAAASITYAER